MIGVTTLIGLFQQIQKISIKVTGIIIWLGGLIRVIRVIEIIWFRRVIRVIMVIWIIIWLGRVRVI
jgi:hypothetical protein